MFIFDASTLILIAKAEALDSFLHDVGLEVAIPHEVEKECCSVKKSLDALIIRKALDELRIRVIAVKDRKLVTKLQGDFGLGRGEAEAIVLVHRPDSYLHYCWFRLKLLVHAESGSRCLARPRY
jgi:predicted nucleic acid-binding protein